MAATNDADRVKHRLPICKALISPATETDIKRAYLAGECLGMVEAAAFIIQEGKRRRTAIPRVFAG